MEPPQQDSPTNAISSGDDHTNNKWSELPKDVLIRILKYLDWKTDLPRIRGVCPSWRSALPLNELPQLGSRFPVPCLDKNLPLLLLESRFYLLSPLPYADEEISGVRQMPWLAKMAEIGRNTWHLFNPLNIHEYFFPHPPLTGSINLLDCRILELSRCYTLIGGSDDNAKAISKKVVGGWNFSSGYIFTLLAELEKGGLVFWRLNDQEWTEIESDRILDIAFHNDKFYCFELSTWRIRVIDPEISPTAMEFIPAPDILADPIDDMFAVDINGRLHTLVDLRLVSSDGQLYVLIQAAIDKKVSVIIYVLKEDEDQEVKEKTSWEKVVSLGDRIFFIGYDVSFSLPSASENLPPWKPGSICFFRRPFPLIFDGYFKGAREMPEGAECLDSVNYAEYWRYYSIFEMDKEDAQITSFEDLSKQIYTGLFFPPPAWVKWRCPSLDNVEVRLDGLKYRDSEFQ